LAGRTRPEAVGGMERVNEWLAFGIVAVICGLLAALVRLAGDDEPRPPAA